MDWFIDLLTNWWTDLLSDWLTDGLIYWLIEGLPTNQLIHTPPPGRTGQDRLIRKEAPTSQLTPAKVGYVPRQEK